MTSSTNRRQHSRRCTGQCPRPSLGPMRTASSELCRPYVNARRDARGAERSEITLWWGAQGSRAGGNPGRAVARMSIGLFAPRSARVCIQVGARWVGSPQVALLNAEWQPVAIHAPARNHSRQRRQLPGGAIPLAQNYRCAFLPAAGCRPAARSAAKYSVGVEADQAQRISSRSARLVCEFIRAGALSGPIRRSGAKGVFCKSCDDDTVRLKVCGVLAKRARLRLENLHETRLADAGFADNECELARAIARAAPSAGANRASFVLPSGRK